MKSHKNSAPSGAAKIALAVALLSLAATGASAGVVWDNGVPIADSGKCDSTPDVCSGTGGGWTIYDDFLLAAATNVTGFTYNDYGPRDINTGDPLLGDYVSTNWTIWDSDPFTAFGPFASGSAVAVMTAGDAGSELFTVTGLNVFLGAGTYWLGIQNVLSASDLSTRALSSNSGTYKQSDDLAGCCMFDAGITADFPAGETAFTVEGDLAAPEPATLSLLGIGLFGLYIHRRRRPA